MVSDARKLPMTDEPCGRCLVLAHAGKMRPEAIMPLPFGAFAPLAQDGSGKCCVDCASADALTRDTALTFEMARTATANCRQEEYRLPGMSGLVRAGRMRPSADTLAEHTAWLDRVLPGWQHLGEGKTP